MDDLKESATELNLSLKKTQNEVELLARSIDLKRIACSEEITKQLKALDNSMQSLEKETILLHDLTKKLSTQISEVIPHIALELEKLNQNAIQNLKIEHTNSVEEQNQVIKDAASRLKQIKEEIEKIGGQRIKRCFIGLGIVLTISVLASLGATYAMIKQIPQRVNIQ